MQRCAFRHWYRRRNADVFRISRSLLSAVAIVAIAACTTLPDDVPKGPHGEALAPQPTGPLAEVEQTLRQATTGAESGFLLLDSNADGLRWRLALIDSAQHSLDLQYYVWWGDESGTLLMRHVVAAADRGVRVRLIVDDLSTILKNAEEPRLRDNAIAIINSHPNISIRLFNAWHNRSIGGRLIETLFDFERANQRMHNKLMIADNRATILGGRNIGNEYFGLSDSFNFRDLDVLGIGPVAREASDVFYGFWNSDWVVPVDALDIPVGKDDLAIATVSIAARLTATPILIDFPPDPVSWERELAQLPGELAVGQAEIHADLPGPDAMDHRMPAVMRDLLKGAEREVLITNAYIIPGEQSIAFISGETARGVEYRVLTNSLESHDVPAVNAHYKQWRGPLIAAGVQLHEARADAEVRAELADTPPVTSRFMGLHIKAAVVDRRRSFVGSLNLDPRSWRINSEMGAVIDSPELADRIARAMERDMTQANAWHVILDESGEAVWIAGDRRLDQQPARNFWQRVEDIVFMLFPSSLY